VGSYASAFEAIASDRLAPGGSKRGIGRAELFAPVTRPYSSHPPTWNRLPGEPPMHRVLSAAAIMPAGRQ
jgi:hypothetical protein